MIDDLDGSSSTLRLLAWQALRTYPTRSLLKLLDDDDFIVRTVVARELQVRGGDEVYAWAKAQVASQHVFRRELSAFILGQLGTPETPFRDSSIPLLTQLAADPDAEVRAAAVAGLGHLRAVEASDVIIAASRDRSNIVRRCVAAALGSLARSSAVKSTLEAMQTDADPKVREWASLALEDKEDS